jgi:transposase
MSIINRNERQLRNYSRLLFWATAILVSLSIAMTAKFGWSWGVDPLDKVLCAGVAASMDIVGALAMTGCAMFYARRQYISGTIALVLVVAFAAASSVAIFGYQSSNRVSMAKAREKINQIDSDQLSWLRAQTVTASKDRKETMFGEVKEQVAAIKSTGATMEPDAQAEEIAAAVGVSADKVRRWLNLGTSATVLAGQFACLWLYGFIRHRVEPEIAEQQRKNTPRIHPGLLATKSGMTIDKARDDIVALFASGGRLQSGKEASQRWGVDEATGSRWLDAMREEGLVVRKKWGRHRLVLPGRMIRTLNASSASPTIQ